MNVQTFEMPRAEALKEWRSYNASLKVHNDRQMKDMRAIYNQLKSGRKVIDVYESLRMAGINNKNQPRLAICPADAANCLFVKNYDNTGRFSDAIQTWRPPASRTVTTSKDCYAPWPRTDDIGMIDRELVCPVPIIPARFRPVADLSKFWLLWEVEEWTNRPPTDPMLLKRLTPNMFVVLAVWDLSPLERAVIRGRMA